MSVISESKYVDLHMGAGYQEDTLDDPQILRLYQEQLFEAFREYCSRRCNCRT